MIGLNESIYNRLSSKNVLILTKIFTFLNINGKYIYSSWYLILCIIRNIHQLKKCKPELMYYVLKIKNIDLKIFIGNYLYNKNLVDTINEEEIFDRTKEYSLDILNNFVVNLIKISDDEINLFKSGNFKKNEERFFCFNKLNYVININRERLDKDKNIQIYKIIKEYFTKLLKENPSEDIFVNVIKDSFIMKE